MKRNRILAAAIPFVLSLSPLAMHAQYDSASVLGYVRDASGAAVADANVTLTSVETSVSVHTRSDKDGKFEFPSAKIGDYRVTAEAAGFSKSDSEVFSLTVNARQRVDLGLKAGSVNDTVTVISAASLLETESSSHSQVIGTQQVENLPLNGRSYADLTLLAPGVRKSGLENQSTTSREGSFNVNGIRSAFNNFMLDGLDNNNYGTSNQGFANENIPPSPDAIDEFRVETNNYSAEYGRSVGAVINAVVRRGTNRFHGRAWDYDRNTMFNAIGPFLAPGATKPKFIRNQFGGTFGGPIWKDHTFFFADYEGVRQIFNNASASSTLPTNNQRNGLFYLDDDTSNAAKAIPLQDPITGRTFNGSIPNTQWTLLARNVITALPTPTTTGLSNNYSITPRGVINDDKGDVRLDHTFNQKLTMFARYSQHAGYIFDPPSIGGAAGGNSNGNTKITNNNAAIGVTYAISASMLFDARFGWTQNKGGKTPVGVGQPSLLVASGITDGLPTAANVVRPLNAQSVTGYSQFGALSSDPQFQNPTIFNPKVNFTWLKGRHSLKFGYENQVVRTEVNDFNPSYGSDTYSGTFAGNGSPALFSTLTAAQQTAYASQLQQARNLADFYFGNRSQYSLTNYTVVNLRQHFNFMYVQDDFKLSPNLTINAGLRYEIATPQYERDNKLANFDPATKTLIQASNGSTYNRALVNTPMNNVAPRFGFAYQAAEKTVVRGGYGIGYTQFNRAGGENNLTYNGPNVVNAAITQTPSLGLCTTDTQLQSACFRQTQQGYSNVLTSAAYFNPANVTSRYIPKDFKTGYLQSYFIGIQQEFGHGWVTELSYVGNKGTHFQILADYNQGTPCIASSTVTCGSLASRRPVQGFGDIEIAYGGGPTNYNALQLRVEKRTSKGLYLLNSFTYGRAFDLSGGHLDTGNGDNSRVDYSNPKASYGPSTYDQPLSDTLSVVYDLPYGHGRRFGANSGKLVDEVLGGWQLTLINSMSSGQTVNVNYSLASSSGLYGTDLVTYRPNRITGANIYGMRTKTATSVTGVFNSAAFSLPTTYPWGNSSRNPARSNSFYQADLGLHKAFALWNDASFFDFRAEAFNVLNKANYAAPNSTFGGSTFGAITTAFPARQLQLAAKVIF